MCVCVCERASVWKVVGSNLRIGRELLLDPQARHLTRNSSFFFFFSWINTEWKWSPKQFVQTRMRPGRGNGNQMEGGWARIIREAHSRSRTEIGAALWLGRKKRRKGPPSGAVRLNWGVQETHAALPHGSPFPFHPAEICGEIFFFSISFFLPSVASSHGNLIFSVWTREEG